MGPVGAGAEPNRPGSGVKRRATVQRALSSTPHPPTKPQQNHKRLDVCLKSLPNPDFLSGLGKQVQILNISLWEVQTG